MKLGSEPAWRSDHGLAVSRPLMFLRPNVSHHFLSLGNLTNKIQTERHVCCPSSLHAVTFGGQ